MMCLIYCRVSYFLANFWVVMSLKALMVSGEISGSLVIACNKEHLFRASLIYTVLGEKRKMKQKCSRYIFALGEWGRCRETHGKAAVCPPARWGFWPPRLWMLGSVLQGNLSKSTPCFLHMGGKKKRLSYGFVMIQSNFERRRGPGRALQGSGRLGEMHRGPLGCQLHESG